MSTTELTAQARAYFELMQQIADLEAEAEAIKANSLHKLRQR